MNIEDRIRRGAPGRLLLALALVAPAVAGCAPAVQPSVTAVAVAAGRDVCDVPMAGPRAADDEDQEDKGDRGAKEHREQSHDAPHLVRGGDRLRDVGLREQADSVQALAGKDSLEAAAECYSRALQLEPDSYEAKLGIGVAYLAQASALTERDNERKPLLVGAKKSLGEAYMLRQGPYEPLYYLAEVALLEKDYDGATKFLQVLYDAKAKRGTVAALLGFIAEKQGQKDKAKAFYREALQAGPPYETLLFVSEKIKGEH